MKTALVILSALVVLAGSPAGAVTYTGVMDNRSGFPFVPGFTAQSLAWATGGSTGGGLRLEWQADNETAPGFWTYTYRLLRGSARNKGFAFFDVETANDFTSANIKSWQMVSATDRYGNTILDIATITLSNPVTFNAVHDFSNAAVTEANFDTMLNKTELCHYSGDPGRVPPGQPGGLASATPSVGPVPHPFFGLRLTFPGAFFNQGYDTCAWEFRVVSDRGPMWGSFFGWGDQTIQSPYWYANFYNNNIDNPVRLTLAPASNTSGGDPYQGWVLVPGSLLSPPATASLSVSLGGSGTGTVHSDTGGIACATGSPASCSATYIGGTPVTLTAAPDWKSLFGGWSGGVTGTENTALLTLNNDTTVQATFTPNNQVRLSAPLSEYPSLQQAYDAADDGATLQARVYTFLEPVDFSLAKTVTLDGGWNASYTDNAGGYTAIRGTLTVSRGLAVVANIILL
jgi:hypothetical protein